MQINTSDSRFVPIETCVGAQINVATNQVEQLATCLFKKMAIQNKIDVLDHLADILTFPPTTLLTSSRVYRTIIIVIVV